jgi:hypothetical protein
MEEVGVWACRGWLLLRFIFLYVLAMLLSEGRWDVKFRLGYLGFSGDRRMGPSSLGVS